MQHDRSHADIPVPSTDEADTEDEAKEGRMDVQGSDEEQSTDDDLPPLELDKDDTTSGEEIQFGGDGESEDEDAGEAIHSYHETCTEDEIFEPGATSADEGDDAEGEEQEDGEYEAAPDDGKLSGPTPPEPAVQEEEGDSQISSGDEALTSKVKAVSKKNANRRSC